MSLKDSIKKTKLYEKYHFHAKYHKTKNDIKINTYENTKVEPLFNDSYVHFFGYYDKPCIYNGKALSHRLLEDNFDYSQTVDILIDNEKVSESKTWNFQQGAMSTWLDKDHIIHNDLINNHYVSKIVDINTKEFKIIDYPIYSVCSDKMISLSLNFSRLAKLRKDYGYFNLPYKELPSNDQDGIYYVDLNNNTHNLWLSLKEIINFKTKDSMNKAVHKVNHITISPKGDKAIFLHRWFVKNIKYTRLLLVDIETKKLTLLADNDMVSHMCWYDNDTLFGYLRGNNGKEGYFFVDMNGNQIQFEHELLVDDGHPTIINERYIVTDSYPDYTCKSKLLLIDLKEKSVCIITRFYSYKEYQGDRRCDLHPRHNDINNELTIDTVYSGCRNVDKVILDL